jgi:PAS domain S-box-containing protein
MRVSGTENQEMAGYFTLSAGGAIQHPSVAASGMFGQGRERLGGTGLDHFLGRADRDRWARVLASLIHDGEARSVRLTLRRQDGSTLPVQLACFGTLAPGGEPFVQVVIADISEQVDREDELRRRLERLTSVVGEFQDGYWEWSASTGETVMSGRLVRMLGLSEVNEGAELALDPSWLDRIHPDDLPVARAAMGDLLDGEGDRCDVEVRWSMPSGPWKWMRVRGRVVRRDRAGGVVRLAGTAADAGESTPGLGGTGHVRARGEG